MIVKNKNRLIKLSFDDVLSLFKRRLNGETYKEISEDLGVCALTLQNILMEIVCGRNKSKRFISVNALERFLIDNNLSCLKFSKKYCIGYEAVRNYRNGRNINQNTAKKIAKVIGSSAFDVMYDTMEWKHE